MNNKLRVALILVISLISLLQLLANGEDIFQYFSGTTTYVIDRFWLYFSICATLVILAVFLIKKSIYADIVFSVVFCIQSISLLLTGYEIPVSVLFHWFLIGIYQGIILFRLSSYYREKNKFA